MNFEYYFICLDIDLYIHFWHDLRIWCSFAANVRFWQDALMGMSRNEKKKPGEAEFLGDNICKPSGAWLSELEELAKFGNVFWFCKCCQICHELLGLPSLDSDFRSTRNGTQWHCGQFRMSSSRQSLSSDRLLCSASLYDFAISGQLWIYMHFCCTMLFQICQRPIFSTSEQVCRLLRWASLTIWLIAEMIDPRIAVSKKQHTRKK